jgi:hypothetical protein
MEEQEDVKMRSHNASALVLICLLRARAYETRHQKKTGKITFCVLFRKTLEVLLLCSVRPKPLFWFRSDTET